MPKVHRVCRTTSPPAPSDLERHAPSVAGKFRPPGRAPPRGLTQPPGSAREEVPPTPPGYVTPSSSHGAVSATYLNTLKRLARGPFCFGLALRGKQLSGPLWCINPFIGTRRPHKNSISPTIAPYGHACAAPFWCLASAQRALCDVPNGYVDRG